MTISKDLFLAILAMDSYSRCYGAGLADGLGRKDADGNDADGLGEAGARIGASTVLNIALPANAQAAGFYAVAYDVSGVAGFADGTTVISYRGVVDDADIASDIVNGWVAAITPQGARPPARGLAA